MRVVFDLDGTIALDDHRAHFIQRETRDYDAYFAACGDDVPNWPVIWTLQALEREGHTIEIWTGRRYDTLAVTTAWLENHSIGLDVIENITMRALGDTRAAVVLKKLWLDESRREGKAPDLVFEDRDCLVKMFREEAVPCFQVAPGRF